MHLNSRLLFEKYAVPLIQPGMRVLEIGPDRFPSTLRSCVKTSSIQWLTMDMYDSERLDFTNL
jgi:hypothetical protein